ncbi:MAG: 30S ribosome-binding factor RbfA [Thermoguttaceae bacterium]
MPSRRVEKAAAAIREVVSMAILAELSDPRVRDVTVTFAEVSPDLRHAKVHVSIMGDETRQRLSLRGLQSAAGFLQAKIAERIDIRYTPKLTFVLDQGVKRSIAVAKILQEVLPKNPPTEDPSETDEADASTPEHDGGHTDHAAPPRGTATPSDPNESTP